MLIINSNRCSLNHTIKSVTDLMANIIATAPEEIYTNINKIYVISRYSVESARGVIKSFSIQAF